MAVGYGFGVFVLPALLCFAASCGEPPLAGGGKGADPVGSKTIEAVLKDVTDRFMSLSGVVGTAIGDCNGERCIKVLVVRKSPELAGKIPPRVDGFRVVVEETGEFRRLGS
jgi:hypothetical protein